MQKLSCHKVNDLLSAYLENELDTATTIVIATHLESCKSCSQELESISAVTQLIKESFAKRKDESIQARAKTINDLVRAEITSGTVSTKVLIDVKVGSKSAEKIERPSRLHRSFFFKAVLAASLVAVFSFVSIFALKYYGSYTGPLLAGAARNHRLCSLIEETGVGWYTGEELRLFAEKLDFIPPELSQFGLKLDGAHPCKVFKAPFLHLMYMKGSEPISVYYGSNVAVERLRKLEDNFEPGKIYSFESGDVKVSAFTTSKDRIWIVAGKISSNEVGRITASIKSDVEVDKKQIGFN